MSCYFRHLKELFADIGLTVAAAHKKEVDRIIHELNGVEYKNCPDTWAALKPRLADPRQKAAFAKKLALKLARAGLL